MKPYIVSGLLALLLIGAAAAEYIQLEDEDLYCRAFSISRWCNEEGVKFLENLPPEVLSDFKYINEYAFGDNVRYAGQLRITGISVFSDLTTSSSVEAVYKVKNTGSETVNTEIAALETPENTKAYVDGQLIDADPLIDGLDVTFEPGEEKEIKLVYDEPLYGEIYGYNVNLLFDDMTVDNHVTPTGSFVFRLPRGVALEQCVPSGYTTKTENGRLTISWQKTDFVPWTNPFNDLICKWNVGEAALATGAPEQPAGDSGWVMWVALVIVILGGLFWLYRSGRLEDLLNR